MRLFHELSVRIVQLEQLLEDLNRLLGRIQPVHGWEQHELDAYRERIAKELEPRGDPHEKGTHSAVERAGPLGAPE